jgi:hypothetical protein
MRTILMAAALAALSMAGPATAADKFKITLRGVVTSGIDVFGTLGLGDSADLTGRRVTETYFIDGSAPGAGSFPDSNRSYLEGYGVIRGQFTVAGHTFDLGDNTYSTLAEYYYPGSLEMLDLQTEGYQCEALCTLTWMSAEADNGFVIGSFLHSADWHDLPDTDLSAAAFRDGAFGYQVNPYFEGEETGYVAGYYDWNRATISLSVPEPGAWALMILGFGGAGAMLRRRRTRGAALA